MGKLRIFAILPWGSTDEYDREITPAAAAN
jgi:hypothetical protein